MTLVADDAHLFGTNSYLSNWWKFWELEGECVEKGLHMLLDVIRPLCARFHPEPIAQIIRGFGEIKSILTYVVIALQAAIREMRRSSNVRPRGTNWNSTLLDSSTTLWFQMAVYTQSVVGFKSSWLLHLIHPLSWKENTKPKSRAVVYPAICGSVKCITTTRGKFALTILF